MARSSTLVTVTATLVDIGCLLLLWLRARRDGIRLVDLFGIERSRLGRELLWGLLYLLVLFPIFAGGGTKLASWLIYGTTQLKPAMLAPGLLSERQLPHWAVVYSLAVFGWFGRRPKKSSTKPIVQPASKS